MPVRVLDIAAGHGRYVIEALAGSDVMPDTILLRDYSDINVAAGTRLIADKGLSDIARFVKGDAFDRDSLAMIEPKPTLGIVSGLYELFPDNARSLEGLAAAIPQGSYLVCTGQPWHPQLEFIGRALTSHRQGQAWVMRALAWLLFLAPFFYLTYGGANWLAAQHDHVPSVVFDWEHLIPFIAWTIIPYWSINAFYGLSFFVCTSKAELDTHGLRLLTAQIIAVTCFILVPLRFTFIQPATSGVPGFLFDALTSFDKPFSQAPSLHIALFVILWSLFSRHVPRWSLWLLNAWFLLVAVSVLNHLSAPFQSPLAHVAFTHDAKRRRLAMRYALGGLVLGIAGFLAGGVALFLLWPLAGAGRHQLCLLRRRGLLEASRRTSVASRLLVAPYHAGAWVNSRAWTRSHPDSVAIADGVALGRIPSRSECAAHATINLSASFPDVDCAATFSPCSILIPPDPERLVAAARAIEAGRRDGPVLVYCALGNSRSASAIATWLAMTGRSESVEHAIATARRVRPHIVLGDDARRAIAEAVERAR